MSLLRINIPWVSPCRSRGGCNYWIGRSASARGCSKTITTASTVIPADRWPREHRDDVRVAENMQAHGIETAPLSAFHLTQPSRAGLMFGYAAFPEHALREGVKRLGEMFRNRQKSAH